VALHNAAFAEVTIRRSPTLPMTETDIATNGIHLHVTELDEGPAILFAHGFPDTAYTWRKQMQAVAAVGFRAIAPDMRGYGGSSAPTDPALYTPFQTVGDLVGLLDVLQVPEAIIVGHDWGANVAWNAAMMRARPLQGRVLSRRPLLAPRQCQSAGRDEGGRPRERFLHVRADASVTIPGILYWASGSAPAAEAWNPFDPDRSLHRNA
jgi:pimeloyl-ACP methyl ester carboxylesterase